MSDMAAHHRRVLAGVRSAQASLSPALARIAQTVLDAPDQALTLTVTELAEAAGSSEASVIRFCRDQGFASFQAFKLALATELAIAAPPPEASGHWGDLAGIAERGVTALRETLDLLNPATVTAVSARLLTARRVLIVSVGASAVTALYLQYKLERLGLFAVTHDDPHMAAMAATTLSAADVVVAVSSSGSTIDTVRAAERARGAGAFVVALTNRTRSPLTELAGAVLLGAAAETPLTGGAFASKVSQILIVDMLFESIARTDAPARAAIAATARSVTDRGY